MRQRPRDRHPRGEEGRGPPDSEQRSDHFVLGPNTVVAAGRSALGLEAALLVPAEACDVPAVRVNRVTPLEWSASGDSILGGPIGYVISGAGLDDYCRISGTGGF